VYSHTLRREFARPDNGRSLQVVTVENDAARAFHTDAAGLARFPLVRRQPLAGIPERILALGPVPLISPSLEIGLGPVR